MKARTLAFLLLALVSMSTSSCSGTDAQRETLPTPIPVPTILATSTGEPITPVQPTLTVAHTSTVIAKQVDATATNTPVNSEQPTATVTGTTTATATATASIAQVVATMTQVPSPTSTSLQPTATVPIAAATPTAEMPNPGIDPDLEPGFPVKLGVSGAVGDLGLVVGNIDGDPAQEIVVGTVGSEPSSKELIALKGDGSVAPGWPVSVPGSRYLAMGELSTSSPGLEVISYMGKAGRNKTISEYNVAAFTGQGSPLPGWPTGNIANTGTLVMPVLVDLDGDGLDEVLAKGWIFSPEGSFMSDLAKTGIGLPDAVGDLDGDGDPEAILSNGRTIWAYHHDGTPLPGFGEQLAQDPAVGHAERVVIGDVDGDGAPEIVTAIQEREFPPGGEPKYTPIILIVSSTGAVEQRIPLDSRASNSLRFTLGDLDCDSALEIITYDFDKVYAWKADGTLFPGWPQDVTVYGHHSLVVGDVDSDGAPDIIVIARNVDAKEPGSHEELRAYNRNGQLLPRFPKALPVGAGSLAIANIDGDDRNEIVVTSNHISPQPDAVWAFDLHGKGTSGAVQWGQAHGGPRHQGYYAPDSGCSP